ncbi:signal peptidase I [Sphingomonas piscis]|uniref:Signal peptidase I n=1 Tax=Sphingomonas piscis TaxID=2714943 RepID=A0A6G7YS00_9SPHN|nr:signal peptidase I [Sphingomonas piscis]QIK79520.1 signal peptidase I [Sphingomonas piscis]
MTDTASNTPAPGSPRTGTTKKEGGLIRFFLGVALIAWVVRSLFLATFYIPSGSMLPTLYIGDYLFVAKWPYGYSKYSFPLQFPPFDGRVLGRLPKRGDVIVFRHPVQDADLIKRVIGLPGDTIEVRGGQLILNGAPVSKKPLPAASVPVSLNSPCRQALSVGGMQEAQLGAQCSYPAFLETLPDGPGYTVLDQGNSPADDFPAITVPQGNLFVMGDNRDDSADSRFSPVSGGVGFLPIDHVIGRALVTVWSTDGSASYWKPWTWFSALRGSRMGNGYTGQAE